MGLELFVPDPLPREDGLCFVSSDGIPPPFLVIPQPPPLCRRTLSEFEVALLDVLLGFEDLRFFVASIVSAGFMII